MTMEKLPPSLENPRHIDFDSFNPDIRFYSGELQHKDSSEVQFDPDKRIDVKPDKDGYYTTLEDRVNNTNLDRTDGGERGSWDGARGESMFKPSYQFMKEALAKYGQEGINYNKGEADFSKVSEATVKIDNMTENRYGPGNNFDQANSKLAEQFNREGKDGRTDWTARDVDDYRKDNKLSWHERCDCQTMDLVPTNIHDYFKHSGGVAECKIRDNVGGGFDA